MAMKVRMPEGYPTLIRQKNERQKNKGQKNKGQKNKGEEV